VPRPSETHPTLVPSTRTFTPSGVSQDYTQDRRVPSRYRVLGVLGRGGSATVLHVFDQALQTDRALKLCHLAPNSGGAARVLERLLVEARSMARLTHPNILKVYDIALFESTPYIVMELAPGGTLLHRLQRDGPLSPEAVGRVFLPILDALAHAHAAGVIHRDVKPLNILFSAEDTPLLADFGIALRTDVEVPANHVVAGTRSYMPPEQREGMRLAPSADTYAVGRSIIACMLHRWDHPAGDAPEKRLAVSRPWRALLVRATHADPKLRFQSAEALRDALQAVLPDAAPLPHARAPVEHEPNLFPGLQELYLQRLADRVPRLEELVAHVAATPTAAQELRAAATQLREAAATYGFATLASASERVEHAAPDLLANAGEHLVQLAKLLSCAERPAPDASVWLVDDDPDMVPFLVAACAELGLRVAHAASAATLRAWRLAAPPEVLLLARHLHDGDATSLLEELERELRDTRIIVLCGSDDTEADVECQLIGAHCVLHAPVSAQVLHAAIAPQHTATAPPHPMRPLLQARRRALNDGQVAMLGCLSLEPHPARTQVTAAREHVHALLKAALGANVTLCECRSGATYFLTTSTTRAQVKARLRAQLSRRLPIVLGGTEHSASAGFTECAQGAAQADLAAARRCADRARTIGAGTIVGASQATRAPKRVVLVGDDPALAADVTRLLAQLGVQTLRHPQPGDLERTLDRVNPSLLVIDLEGEVDSPEPTGLDLLEAVRASDRYRELPVVVISGAQEHHPIDLAFDLGASDYMAAPLNPTVFTARVRRLLEHVS